MKLQVFVEQIDDSCHTYAAPDGVSIERTCVGIIAFAWLYRRLVQINNYGKPRHKEEKGHHPELTDAAFTAKCLPEQADEAQQQRHTVEHIMTFVGLQFVRKHILIAQPCIVKRLNTCYPVAVFQLAVTLYIVLPSGEIPHEITPVHEVTLIGKEEPDVVNLRRHLHRHLLSTSVIGNLCALNAAHPRLIVLCVRLIVHAREQHILGVFVLILVRNNKVRVFLILCFLFLSAVNRRTFRHFGLAYIAISLQCYLRSVGLPVQQGAVSILVTAQVRTEREDVFRRILIHWRVGNRANYDERVARIAYHQHQHTQQSRILQAGRNQVFGPFVDSFLIVKQETDNGQNDDSDNNRTPSVAIEWYADEAEGDEERYIFTLFVAVNIALVDGPQHSCHKKDDVNNKSGIERKTETIHK